MRKVILHYHLFKNAGTSLDAALKENFKNDEWVTAEFPEQPVKNREMVKQWIIDSPEAKCFSSHTAILPPPNITGVKIFPLIFIRHPIDRIESIYEFEKKQSGDSFGAVLARNTDFKGYVETRLSLSYDRQCRDFHICRLAPMIGEKEGDEFTRAKMALEKLPFVGLVEDYSASLARLESLLLSEGFDNIVLQPVERNVSRSVHKPIEEKLELIQSKLGDKVWKDLIASNEKDIELYLYNKELIANEN
jgi:hypothetical protein